MTTRRRSPEPRVPVQRRQVARWQRERRQRKWVLVIAAVVFLLVLAIPGYGYYATFVAPPRQMIIEVNSTQYTLGDLSKLIQANVAAIVDQGGTPNLGVLPFQLLNNMVNDELIRQTAPRLGISVTEEEIDVEIRNRFFPSPPGGEQTDLATLEREFQEAYLQYLNITKYSADEYRSLVSGSVLRGKVREFMSDDIPSVEEQVYVHWIVLNDDASVDEVQRRLGDGEPFDRLARIHNLENQYADDNGEVGWVPRQAFPNLDAALFSMEQNSVGEPVRSTDLNTYLLKITDGPKHGEISGEMREALKTRALEKWMTDERRRNEVSIEFGSIQYEWLVDKVRDMLPSNTSREPSQ